ncbi:MAG: rhodanese-like domain-containing protein [Ectothiorhodospiraceae bacterium]|nr:rhodanese-like domain-containing protein [Ectothiorhodospiraceae bacterium]
MKSYDDLLNDCLTTVQEIFPWDLVDELENHSILLIDVSEPDEFSRAHIPDSLNVARGILESACEYDYDDTVPELAAGRERNIVVICRSGRRSALAAHTLLQMGFSKVRSLKTGLRGWNDGEYPLVDEQNKPVNPDLAEVFYTTTLRPEQRKPTG